MTQSAALPFPKNRTCPYHPPGEYGALARPLSRITLYDGREVWAVTGHSVARELMVDQRVSVEAWRDGFPIPDPRFIAGVRDRRPTVCGIDDPEHAAQRRTLIPSFTLKRTAQLRPQIQRTVDELLDAMVAQGPSAELVSAFALPVPSMVICSLLGVPYEDHEFFEAQCRRMSRGLPEDAFDAGSQLDAYLGELIDRKQVTPGDGLLDDLIRSQMVEGTMERADLVALAFILLVAGHETTANMLSLGTFTLLQHPEKLAELRADPSLWPAAVDELMRFLAIADGLLRLAVEDIEIGGTTIKAGEGLVFAPSLINRDADVFDNPDELDWHRPARPHLGFGFGVHQCLGQNLARAEMEIALRTLFDRLPDLRLAAPAEEIPFKPGDTIQGMLELPVTW